MTTSLRSFLIVLAISTPGEMGFHQDHASIDDGLISVRSIGQIAGLFERRPSTRGCTITYSRLNPYCDDIIQSTL
jgi:hypothetical protein